MIATSWVSAKGAVTMGRIVREGGGGVTKYYWYPGNKSDWTKAAIAVGAGAVVFLVAYLLVGNSLLAAVLSSSVTTGVCGAHLGRRIVSTLQEAQDMSAQRRAMVRGSTKAAWRGTVQGFACAGAAVFVLNMPASGFAADWLLPIVPAIVGAIAHTVGMVFERMSQLSKDNTKVSLSAQTEAESDAKRFEPATRTA